MVKLVHESIYEIYNITPSEGGWRVLSNGNRVNIGSDIGYDVSLITFGHRVRLGDNVKLGFDVILGNNVVLGDDVILGDRVRLGDYVILGSRVRLGDDAAIGDCAMIDDDVSAAIDLGHFEGYRKVLAEVNGVAYISAGCHWFTLAQAWKHWADRQDRPHNKGRCLVLLGR